MVAGFTLRTHGVDQKFQFVEGILVTSKESSNLIFFRKRPNLHHACACSELPSYISTIEFPNPVCMWKSLKYEPVKFVGITEDKSLSLKGKI